MIKIGLTATVPVLNEEDLKKVIRKFTTDWMRGAVKRFLTETLYHIPVDTGFLKGSFAQITKKFGATGTGVGQAANNVKKVNYYHTPGGGPVRKTPTSGQPFSISKDEVLQSDEVGGFLFNFGSTIRYYGPNDYGNTVKGTPWLSIDKGLFAMTEILEQAPKSFPSIDKILSELTVTVSGTSVQEKTVGPDIDGIIRTANLFNF